MASEAPSSTMKSSRPCSAKALQQEAKFFLNGKSGFSRRSHAYAPTLEEFQNVSFSDFVRYTLLQDNEDTSSVSSSSDDTPEEEPLSPSRMRTRNHRPEIQAKRVYCDPRLSRKWADGIAKITPPEGWWDRAGIDNDMTARGPKWQSGAKLGDMVIQGPIKQCVAGIGGVYEFSLMNQPNTTVSEFREKADAYRKRQIGKAIDTDYSDENMDRLERRFWKRLGPTMEAPQYGADMDGTFFEGDPACGWNVESLDTCLRLLCVDTEQDNLPGVTSPYLYFGMWGSVFCAHTEDINLCSINYIHAGAPKYWYAISPEDSKRFESLAESHFPHAARMCPEFLRHKRFLLSPGILKKAGISHTTQIQRAGDFMITFPGSYHFGFNTGWNIAESTNFAVPEWIPKALEAKICMCHPHSVRIDMNEFKSLLMRYENDCDEAEKLGKELSYCEWIDAERESAIESNNIDANEDPDINRPDSEIISKKKEFLVEVIRPLPWSGKDTMVSKRSRKKEKDEENWHLAMKKIKGSITTQTRVLCFIAVRGAHDEPVACFAGIVSEITDGHARVHFAGLRREEDLWVEIDSPKLYLDGGPRDPETYVDAGTKKKCKR